MERSTNKGETISRPRLIEGAAAIVAVMYLSFGKG